MNCLSTQGEYMYGSAKQLPPEKDLRIPEIATNSIEYDDLRKNPQYFNYGGYEYTLCLRMHYKHFHVACICGEIFAYTDIEYHKCDYVKLFATTSQIPAMKISESAEEISEEAEEAEGEPEDEVREPETETEEETEQDEQTDDTVDEERPQRVPYELRRLADYNTAGPSEENNPVANSTNGRTLRPRVRKTHNQV